MAKYLLGIDNGSTMAKAALFATDGTELAVASRKVELLSPMPGWSERDSEKVWRDTADAIREVIAKARINPADIACIACTGYGNGLHLVDVAGRPVRNGINSMDSRARRYVEQWLADGVDLQVLPKTTQCLWPAQPNALLRWLRDHEPESVRKAAAALMCKDYIRARLCGTLHAELTDMSGTSLMNVVTANYDDEVLELFGLADLKRLLPPLVKSAEIVGEVTSDAAALTGLKAGTPVAGGLFDIDACALSSGIVDGRQMSLVAGTWGCNQYIAREPVADKGLFMTSCYAIPGWYLMLEGSPTSASNLEWFVTEFMQAEKRAGQPVFDLANQMAASVKPRDADIIFLPFLYGSNASPDARATFVGLQGRHTRAHVVRALYEGIVFGHTTHIQHLLKFRPPPEVIRITGGAARSEVWMQMFADCFQIPVEIPTGTELGALGVAIAAAVACGCHADFPQAVAAMTRIARRYEPDATLHNVYAAKFQKYAEVIRALEPVWTKWQTH
jgi:L-xylulokinase